MTVVIDLDAYRWRKFAPGITDTCDDVDGDEGFDWFEPGHGEEDRVAIEDRPLGRFAVLDDTRVPQRRGGPVGGLSAAEDWQEAERVERAVRTGEMAPHGRLLSVTTFVTGPWANWTVYRTLGYWYDLVWTAGLALAFAPAALWLSFTSSAWFIAPWTAGLLAWTILCQIPAESDAKIRRRLAASADA